MKHQELWPIKVCINQYLWLTLVSNLVIMVFQWDKMEVLDSLTVGLFNIGLLAPYACYHILVGKIAAHSAYEMFLWYKYLIVSLVFRPRFLDWESFSDCDFS